MYGKIVGLRNCGTIILIHMDSDDGKFLTIPCDRRSFRWMLEGEGCEARELLGRRISHDDGTINFVDEQSV